MHRMFGEQVDAKLFASFGEAPLSVKSEDVREDAPALIEMHQVKKLQGHLRRRMWEGAIHGSAIIVVDSRMLMVKSTIENAAAERVRREHTGNEGSELDVAVVQLSWNWTSKLHLIGLEAAQKSAINDVI